MANNPDKRHQYHLTERYKLTPAQYEAKVEEQGGRCLICKGPVHGKRRGHVDHDHETGVIRGILCHGCNTGIGGLGEDPNNLRAAIAHLERFQDHSIPL